MAKAKIKSLSRSVTMKDLGEFTEQVILPGVEKMIAPVEAKIDKVGRQILSKLDGLEFKIASASERTHKDSENLNDWIKEVDERLTTVEIKVRH